MEQQISQLTDFDALTFSNRLKILKTLFPYMPPASRRILSSYIKTTELTNALRMCSNTGNHSLGACSDENMKSPVELLSDIKNFCTQKEQETIDTIMNFYSVFQMYRSYMELEKSDSQEGSMMDMIMGMLSPEQQSMFDTYQQTLQTDTLHTI